MVAVLIASFIIALLSGLGIGGGGLFVVFLNLFTDLPQLKVQGINLLFFIFSATSAVLVHLMRRRIYYFAVLVMVLFGILGAIGGIFLARYVREDILRKIFGVMLVISGMLTLQQKRKKDQ
jgi:uncharacterized membrane protein YfcA